MDTKYENRKAGGLCTGHRDRNAVVGKTVCQECLDAMKARYAFAKATGFCTGHPSRVAMGGKTRCQECVDKEKARVSSRKAQGRCQIHPGRIAMAGRTQCQKCVDRDKARHVALKAGGKCTNHFDRAAVKGKTRCQECLDYKKAQYWASKTKGVCPFHIDRNIEVGSTVCQECLWRSITRHSKWTMELYDSTYISQKGKCALCGVFKYKLHTGKGKSDVLVSDHCHTSNKPRALLCQHCNTFIGLFEKYRALVPNIEKYLAKYTDQSIVEKKNAVELAQSTGLKIKSTRTCKWFDENTLRIKKEKYEVRA